VWIVMKEVKFQWEEKRDKDADTILTIGDPLTGLELAQLRRCASDRVARKNRWFYRESAYDSRVWQFRPVHPSDKVIEEYFGKNWQAEAWNGFETVSQFRDWVEHKRTKVQMENQC
jgi:hypothetical protein